MTAPRCAIHPTEPVRRFGDVLRCCYCGEIVGTVREPVVPVVPPGARRLTLVDAAKLGERARPALYVPRPPAWRRRLGELLRRWARALDPEGETL